MKRLTISLVVLAGLALAAQAQARGTGHHTSSRVVHHNSKKDHRVGKKDHRVEHVRHRFHHRPRYWVRSWCRDCGCWCWWNPRLRCYYYWYAPESCYVPVSYCPGGRYDYPDEGTGGDDEDDDDVAVEASVTATARAYRPDRPGREHRSDGPGRVTKR